MTVEKTQVQLLAHKNAILDKLKDLVDNPRPSYREGEEQFDWNQYHSMLMKQMEMIDKQLAGFDAVEEIIYFDDPDL